MKKKLLFVLAATTMLFTAGFNRLTYEDIFLQNEDTVQAHIGIPITGTFIDELLSQWAHNFYHLALAQANEANAKGELHIGWEIFWIGDRYTGVLENGDFTHSGMAHPQDVIAGFNFDMKEEKPLTNEEILDMKRSDEILKLIVEELTKAHPDTHIFEPDASWLNHLVLTNDGVMVVLERGTALPGSEGTQRVTLSFESLGDLFLLGKDKS